MQGLLFFIGIDGQICMMIRVRRVLQISLILLTDNPLQSR